ncbi:MAG: FecR domain-containing protein [Natronospirillum sp.]
MNLFWSTVRPLLWGALLGLSLWSGAAWASSHDVVARVVAVQGDAVLNAGASLSRGSALRQGDLVSTGADARLRLRFLGGSLLTLGGETQLEVTRYEPATEDQAQQAYFRLLDGVMLAVADGVTQGESDYIIETTAGTMGIRGTIVWGGYFVPGQADFVLFEGGPVEITNDLGSVTLTTPGQGTSIPIDDDQRGLQAPFEPALWSPAKVFNASTTIAF